MRLHRTLTWLLLPHACSCFGEPDYDLIVRGRAWTGLPDGGCRASPRDWDWR
jgi:hypothetical protein